MQTQIDCIPCFVRQALDALKQVCDDTDKVESIMRKVLKVTSEFDFELSPPQMGQIIHRIIREETKNPDPYREIKKRSTECALSLEEEVRREIRKADDSFTTALKFSIAGNILDFALLTSWDSNRINESFKKAIHQPINLQRVNELKNELKDAKNVLILGDNAGESVFDKILIKNIESNANIFYAVKGSPIINDVTQEDAIEANLDIVSQIISNGNDAPGTVLSDCSQEFLDIYNLADVVIAKGQANFETLNKEEKKVYLLTQMKCNVIAEKYNFKVGDWIITTTTHLKEIGLNTI